MVPGTRHVPRVLLATDLGPASIAATEAAIELARDLRGTLLVVSVLEPGRGTPFGARIDQIRERRERGAREIADRARAAGVAAAFLVWQGEPGPSVVAAAEAEGADFIILGSNQRPRVSRLLLGSTSDHVLRSAPCPVLIVRPDDALEE
jgi:nucleotide-binding universal stress UspA family protein